MPGRARHRRRGQQRWTQCRCGALADLVTTAPSLVYYRT